MLYTYEHSGADHRLVCTCDAGQCHVQGGPKSKPDNCCNNFVYLQPIFIILAHIHYMKFATGGCIASPPNMVCVTALPCKILITTYPYVTICLHMFTTINNNKHRNICTFDTPHVQKRHNTDYGTLLKCYPWPWRIFLQNKCPLLSRIARNLSLC